MLKQGVWMLAAVPALVAGWTDWRFRRIPNWLTVPALVAGIAVNSLAAGWPGAKESLLGVGLGLGLLLPFVLIRSLGAGDWKLVGALGAFLGPSRLITVLLGTILVAGLMAWCWSSGRSGWDGQPAISSTWWLDCLRCTCRARRFRWIIRNL